MSWQDSDDIKSEPGYQRRLQGEVRYFEGPMGILPLPEAFHYWSNKYLRPEVERIYGRTGVIEIYAAGCAEAFRATGVHRALSIGTGKGEVEVAIAQRLVAEGFEDFRIDCLELAPRLVENGHRLAEEKQVSRHLDFIQADMNEWVPEREGIYAAVIANQILHHIYALEHFFESTKRALVASGKFFTRDMIGRNGHQCWPEMKAVVDQIWSVMPKRYTHDHIFKRAFDEYPNRDCSTEAFEGIRSQDVLPLLCEGFHFERFIAFGGLMERFCGRAFGHNIDVEGSEGDRLFVDMLYLLNKTLIDSGAIKPTQVIASLTMEPVAEPLYGWGWSPEWCLRPTGA